MSVPGVPVLSWVVTYLFSRLVLKIKGTGAMYTTAAPETHSNQNGISSFKLSLHRKTNFLQKTTKNITF
jgi:hypothetical protein